MTPPPDLATTDDVRLLVRRFYRGLDAHPVLGRFFDGVDLDAHQPRMVAFWSSVIFQTGTYRGRPFDAHLRLPSLSTDAFDAWLARFEGTVDALFEGPNAQAAKARARQIAMVFQAKLGLLPAT